MSGSAVPAVCCRQRGVRVKYEPMCPPAYTHAHVRTSLRVGKWDIRVSRSRWWHGVEGKVNSGTKTGHISGVSHSLYWEEGAVVIVVVGGGVHICLTGGRITAWSCSAWTILTHSKHTHTVCPCWCSTSIICIWGLLCFHVSRCQFNICYHKAASFKLGSVMSVFVEQ